MYPGQSLKLPKAASILPIDSFKGKFPRFFAWYSRHVTQKTLLGQFLRKSRRFVLGTFYPEYIQKAISETRTGDCHRCGLCCELIYKCPFLGKDSQNLPYCRVYGDLRPANCRNYPFDPVDSEVDSCGFKFTK